jgi:hypothetical protein
MLGMREVIPGMLAQGGGSMLRVGRSTEADAQIPLELSHPFAELRLGLAGRARRGGEAAVGRATCAK